MKLRSLLTASLALIAISAHAATITDTWSTEGGAWDPQKQPQFEKTGVLNPDAGSQGGGKLINPDKQGIFESVFYSFFSAPDLTVSTDSVADGVKSVTLEVIISKEPSKGPTLNFNSGHKAVAPTTVSEAEATDINGHDAKTRTYVWDVSELGQSDALSIDFSLNNHTAFKKLQLIQKTDK